MGENSVSMQGKSFSSYQLNTLKIAPCQNYIFILDREALMNSIKYCIELVKVGKKVKVVILPDDRDPNDLGYDETKKLVDSFNYQSYNQLLSLKYKYATNPEFAH
jgi:DNA primase